jgi:hypothetical protein
MPSSLVRMPPDAAAAAISFVPPRLPTPRALRDSVARLPPAFAAADFDYFRAAATPASAAAD